MRIGRSFAWARCGELRDRPREGDPVGGGEGLRRDRGVRAVDQDEDVGRLAVQTPPGVVGRDLDADRGAARDDDSFKRRARRRVGHDVEVARVDEIVQELAALLGSALVEDDGADVFDVRVDQAEEDELEGGDQERELERAPVADHLDRLLPQDRQEPSHRGRPRLLAGFRRAARSGAGSGARTRPRARPRSAGS